jgi:hypothetical protein
MGEKNAEPGDNSLNLNKSCVMPIRRWSRFAASSMRNWYSFICLLSGKATPYLLKCYKNTVNEGCCHVHALQGLVLAVAEEIRGGVLGDGKRSDFASGGHVGAAAEVDEGTAAVGWAPWAIWDLGGDDAALELVVGEQLQRLFFGKLQTLERLVGLDDFSGARFVQLEKAFAHLLSAHPPASSVTFLMRRKRQMPYAVELYTS